LIVSKTIKLKIIQNYNFACCSFMGVKLGLALKEEQSWRMRWVGHVARMVKRGGVYRILIGKPEGT
jgi:hypothetical protein